MSNEIFRCANKLLNQLEIPVNSSSFCLGSRTLARMYESFSNIYSILDLQLLRRQSLSCINGFDCFERVVGMREVASSFLPPYFVMPNVKGVQVRQKSGNHTILELFIYQKVKRLLTLAS